MRPSKPFYFLFIFNWVLFINDFFLITGIRHMLSIARLGNQLMQASQPWVLLKGDEQEQKRGKTVIGLSCNLACLLSVLLHPYMPETSDVIRQQLNSPPEVNVVEDQFTLLLKPGHQLGKVGFKIPFCFSAHCF